MSTATDYSYRKDFPTLAGPVDGCAVDTTIDDSSVQILYSKGVSFSGFELDNRQRVPAEALAAQITNLKSTGQWPEKKLQVDEQIQVDTEFYQAVKREYCWYENRYSYLLPRYLKLLASKNKSDITLSQGMVSAVTNLNKRLQSLLEIMNAVANERATQVDGYRARHVRGNNEINTNINKLAEMKRKLGVSNLRLTTQKEMMKYTEEKNRALRVQITIFAVLNVVALGVVYTAYKQSQ
jgi:hypothetical protein